MFKTLLTIAAHPDLNLKVKAAPMSVDLGGHGALAISIGELEAHCDAIPLSVTIPFLRRRGGRVIAGAVGPFGVRLKPVEAQVRAFDVGVHGMVGKDGIDLDLRGVGACKAEIEASGKLPAKVIKAAVESTLDDD
jgi:hypothetical protein